MQSLLTIKAFLETYAQLFILLLGTIGILMMSVKSRWGVVVGLLAQPFWLTTTYINDQWGMFYNAIGYTFSLLIGIYFWFFPKKKWLAIIELDGQQLWVQVESKSKMELAGLVNGYLGGRGNILLVPLDEVAELSENKFKEKLGYLQRIIQTAPVNKH